MPQFPASIAAALLLDHSWGLWSKPAKDSPPQLFTDVSLQAGITWRRFNGHVSQTIELSRRDRNGSVNR